MSEDTQEQAVDLTEATEQGDSSDAVEIVDATETPSDMPDMPETDALEDSEAGQEAGDTAPQANDDPDHGDSSEQPEPATRSRGAVDLVRQGDVAADYLEGLLDILDLDGDIDIDVENGRAHIDIVEASEGDLETLVGNEGEVLNALQDLTRLAVTRQTGERSRLMLDIAGFRQSHRETLQQIGRDAVAEVESSGEPVRLAAMNSFERKVVHDVAAESGLTSESEGTDPQRYVVILPA